MSFFANGTYSSFHSFQQPSKETDPKTSPSKMKTSARLDNISFVSSGSTASMSELDPFSPINLSQSTDPWGENTLFLSPTYGHDPYPPSFSSSASATIAAASLKIFAEDQDQDTDDWSEFMSFGKAPGSPLSVGCGSSQGSGPPSPERVMHPDHGGGWQRLPFTTTIKDDDDCDEQEEEASIVAYNGPSRASSFTSKHVNFSEAPASLASRLLSRLFSSTSSSPSRSRSSSFSLPWSSSPVSSPAGIAWNSAPALSPPKMPRNYESYDVNFEKGPIGLELETDWYGRQAVVKGFKKIDNEDGPAKRCQIIRIGDVLTDINGISCLEMSFNDTLAMLRSVSSGPHSLHFKSLEAAGDLSLYAHDTDVIQAKKFIHEHKERFYKPPPASRDRELIRGCVERLRGENVTAFNFHREDTGEFLLACSCANDCTGVFIFHTLQDSHLRELKDLPQNEDSAIYLGQMQPNFIGTEFTVLDHQQKRRSELGFLVYSSNVLGRVPNFLKCVFPRPPAAETDAEEDHDGDISDREKRPQAFMRPIAATTGSASRIPPNTILVRNGSIADRYKLLKQSRQLSIVERLRHFSLDDLEQSFDYLGGNLDAIWHDADDLAAKTRSMRMRESRTGSTRSSLTPYGAVEQDDYHCDLLTFETKKPAWNDDLCAWTLNFQGRVKVASKKNFLLVAEQGNQQMEAEFSEDSVYLRFGKVSKTRFALDFQAPISPMLALAIACSSFSHKIAVT